MRACVAVLLVFGACAVMAAQVSDEMENLDDENVQEEIKKIESIDSMLKAAPKAPASAIHVRDIPGYKQTPKDKQDESDGDHLYKQRGTYTEALKQMDARYKELDAMAKKHWDYLNDFKDPNAKVAKAKKIADDIFNIVDRPIKKRVIKTEEAARIKALRDKGLKDAAYLKRIIKRSLARDRRSKARSQKRKDLAAKLKANPKIAPMQTFLSQMAAEDKALTDGLKKMAPDAATVEEAKEDGKKEGQRKPVVAEKKAAAPAAKATAAKPAK